MAEGGEDGKYGLIKFLPNYLKLFSGFYEMSQTFCNTMFYRNCFSLEVAFSTSFRLDLHVTDFTFHNC